MGSKFLMVISLVFRREWKKGYKDSFGESLVVRGALCVPPQWYFPQPHLYTYIYIYIYMNIHIYIYINICTPLNATDILSLLPASRIFIEHLSKTLFIQTSYVISFMFPKIQTQPQHTKGGGEGLPARNPSYRDYCRDSWLPSSLRTT